MVSPVSPWQPDTATGSLLGSQHSTSNPRGTPRRHAGKCTNAGACLNDISARLLLASPPPRPHHATPLLHPTASLAWMTSLRRAAACIPTPALLSSTPPPHTRFTCLDDILALEHHCDEPCCDDERGEGPGLGVVVGNDGSGGAQRLQTGREGGREGGASGESVKRGVRAAVHRSCG